MESRVQSTERGEGFQGSVMSSLTRSYTQTHTPLSLPHTLVFCLQTQKIFVQWEVCPSLTSLSVCQASVKSQTRIRPLAVHVNNTCGECVCVCVRTRPGSSACAAPWWPTWPGSWSWRSLSVDLLSAGR